MSPKVMYPQQQIFHITFGMNVINWHASTDNWAAAYRLLQNYMWASEDADQPVIINLFYGNVIFDPIGRNV